MSTLLLHVVYICMKMGLSRVKNQGRRSRLRRIVANECVSPFSYLITKRAENVTDTLQHSYCQIHVYWMGNNRFQEPGEVWWIQRQATGWTVRGLNPGRSKWFLPKTVTEPPIQLIPRFFPLRKAAGNVKLTTRRHLGSIVRISAGMPLPFSICPPPLPLLCYFRTHAHVYQHGHIFCSTLSRFLRLCNFRVPRYFPM